MEIIGYLAVRITFLFLVFLASIGATAIALWLSDSKYVTINDILDQTWESAKYWRNRIRGGRLFQRVRRPGDL